MHLTDLKIRALPFEEGQRDYTDGAVQGLSIRVGRRTKTFMLVIGKGDHRRRVKIGQYPDLSLAEAREAARDRLAEARLTKQSPRSITFESAFEQFKATHIPTMRLGSQRNTLRLYKRFATLNKRKLIDIKTTDLAEQFDAIRAPAEKMNSFIFLRSFLNWCYRRGYIDVNPISRLKAPPSSQARERVLSDTELVRVWNEASESDFGAYIRILILSAQRKGQWLQFRPEFIDGDTIVFPAQVMKMGKTHVIPLTPAMRTLLSAHTFRGFKESRNKKQLMDRSQTSGWTVHDLRRTVATRMAQLGIAPHVVERLLAHAMPGVAARYNRYSYLTEQRDALQRWENHLQTLLSSTESTTNGRDLPGVHQKRADAA